MPGERTREVTLDLGALRSAASAAAGPEAKAEASRMHTAWNSGEGPDDRCIRRLPDVIEGALTQYNRPLSAGTFRTFKQVTSSGAGGARTHDRRIMRTTAPCTSCASRTDDTGYRTDGTHGAGIVRRVGPRTGPRPKRRSLRVLLLCVTPSGAPSSQPRGRTPAIDLDRHGDGARRVFERRRTGFWPLPGAVSGCTTES